VGSATLHYQGWANPVQLTNGNWYGIARVQLVGCAAGDLDHDGVGDLIGAVVQTGGGTEELFTLVFWHNNGGHPVFSAMVDLGDHAAVFTITVHAETATVWRVTRRPTDPIGATTILRTSIYRVSGATLVEVSHTDVPYTGFPALPGY
jgi:hypothetical protein